MMWREQVIKILKSDLHGVIKRYSNNVISFKIAFGQVQRYSYRNKMSLSNVDFAPGISSLNRQAVDELISSVEKNIKRSQPVKKGTVKIIYSPQNIVIETEEEYQIHSRKSR